MSETLDWTNMQGYADRFIDDTRLAVGPGTPATLLLGQTMFSSVPSQPSILSCAC